MKLEALEDKNLQLTDALGRAQDELNISGNDIEGLTKKIDEQNEEIAILQEQLQASSVKMHHYLPMLKLMLKP